MTVNINGLPVHVYLSEGGGETVLFLHGWGAHIGLYRPIFDQLEAKGYRVAAFDMPGVGQTPDPAAPLTVEDYMALALAVWEALGITEGIYFAHSHGGRIALPLLARADSPIACTRAVLMDITGAPSPKPAGAKLRQAGYKAAKALGTHRLTAPIFGELYRDMRERRASADYKAASPVMRQTMNNVLPADFTAIMPQIKAQTLLIWGEGDTATPLAEGQTMERLIPGAGLAVIRNAGHFCFMDNWPQFSAVLDAFL